MYEVHAEKVQLRPEMIWRVGWECAGIAVEYVDALEFQSCDGSSYCTVLRENGYTDIVSCQLWDPSMIRWWSGQFTEGRINVHDEDRIGQLSLAMGTDGKCVASSFAELALHNFRTIWLIPPDVSLISAQNCLPVTGKHFHNDSEVKAAVTSWLQMLAVDSFDTCIQMLVAQYDKCLNNGDYVEK